MGNLTKPGLKRKKKFTGKPKYLKQDVTDRIYIWTKIQAERKDMTEITAKDAVPYLKEQTGGDKGFIEGTGETEETKE